MYRLTTATRKLSKLRNRIRGVAGGTSAGKTISILQLLIDDAQTDKEATITSVVSESFPHLRRGAMRDFLSIMQSHGYFRDERWSKSEYVYTFESGSKIEFFSADQPGKVRGPRRDRLFVNEANNIPYETWTQLLVRTKQYAWADWNPTHEFWFYEELLNQREDLDFITLTYRDNEALSLEIVAEIESRRNNRMWWQVYGLGQLGEVEGRVFTGWKTDLEEIPHEAVLQRRGLDFGYSNDPTVIVDVYYYNGGYILDEVVYMKGMKNKDIVDRLLSQPEPQTLVIADSSEAKSIDEIAEHGVNIVGVEKQPGYVRRNTENSLIDWVQSQKISITKRSTNLIKSYRNFMWKTDKEGKILNEYDHYWSDGMMAAIYGLSNFKPTPRVVAKKPDDMLRLKYGAINR